MFDRVLQRQLRPGEELIRIVRRSFLAFLWPSVVAACFIIAPFFFLVPLFRWVPWGVIGFFVLVLLGVVLTLRVAVSASLTAFLLTNERIIDVDQRGFFDRTVSEARYDSLVDVRVRVKGMLQTLFRLGDVIVQTTGATTTVAVRGVRKPEKVQALIVELQENLKEAAGASREDTVV